MLLKDKVAIVTGAGSLRGIGFATAKRFVEEGARVAIIDLDRESASAAAQAVGEGCRGYVCDVRDAARCEAVVGEIRRDFSGLDILVNNAGVSQPTKLLDVEMIDYDLVMDVSVRGAFNMSRAVVPHFKRQKSGAIVCMGSVAAQRGGGVLGGPHYASAKGAVQTMAKAMARELGAFGIRVNAIAPGLVDTDLLVGKITEDRKALVAGGTSVGRLASADDIADAFLFLGSDLSSFTTGYILDVNGGLHIH
ncbi:SDR family oxidoreductase [Paraburkholderia sp. 22B1P]|uniref:SDR family NAD(P)-dependent oxidoreductase n=1 Tax=Paraburkholderia sp. 22B1P TaxID=3080498 RepID=UPI003087C559|nr:SDR family NAD(P)-dependent oxidoreductase [Paraburkholderia sp. 22B1P]